MNRGERLRALLAAAVATAALAAPLAASAAEPPTPGAALAEPEATIAPAPVEQNETLAPPAADPAEPPPSGGVNAGEGEVGDEGADAAAADPSCRRKRRHRPRPRPLDGAGDPLPAHLDLRCHRRAAGPDPDLPAGRGDLRPRSAGAGGAGRRSTRSRPPSAPTSAPPRPAPSAGCSSCRRPGTATGSTPTATASPIPNNPEDAIFAAAGYLSATGMPADTYGAIFAYNHADWYVAEVLANAGCYAPQVGGPGFAAATAAAPGPQLHPGAGLAQGDPAPSTCAPSRTPPPATNSASAASGRWPRSPASSPNFGKRDEQGPARRDRARSASTRTEWKQFAVDGDEDGHIDRADAGRLGRDPGPADLVARQPRSRRSSAHNQAEWYVQEVLSRGRRRSKATARSRYVDWALAPLDTGLLTAGPTRRSCSGDLASAPESAPPAVKAVIAAANSITATPYVWGGGHGSFYSYGYDCSGAVSFALYGARPARTPRSPPARWRATANRARASGSRSTPTPPTPTW